MTASSNHVQGSMRADAFRRKNKIHVSYPDIMRICLLIRDKMVDDDKNNLLHGIWSVKPLKRNNCCHSLVLLIIIISTSIKSRSTCRETSILQHHVSTGVPPEPGLVILTLPFFFFFLYLYY